VPVASTPNPDFLFKISLLGASGVGKTALLARFLSRGFDAHTSSTIGVEFGVRRIEWRRGAEQPRLASLSVWDTAGQERFRAIASAYYRGAAAALVVYDVCSRASFDAVRAWVEEMRDHTAHQAQQPIVILLGNKADMRHARVISTDAGAALARQIGACGFLETSAKDNTNVEEAFATLADELCSAAVAQTVAASGASGVAGGDLTRVMTRGHEVDLSSAAGSDQQQKGVCCNV